MVIASASAGAVITTTYHSAATGNCSDELCVIGEQWQLSPLEMEEQIMSAMTTTPTPAVAPDLAPALLADGVVAVVRLGGDVTVRGVQQALSLCREGLKMRHQVIIDLRPVPDLSAASAALLTRSARNLHGRLALLTADNLRERLAIIGGCFDLVDWSELNEDEQAAVNGLAAPA